MSTLVCFHAHPDDEAISTGGLMAKAAAVGHRVVLVCATRGEQGEPQPGVLDAGEQLWERRWSELTEAARILGAEGPLWLGYEDSGMIGEPTNDNPKCFWQADADEAVNRLSEILNEVNADVLTIYDDHGGYGHPDHIKVHDIGKAAAAAAKVDNVYEATFSREITLALIEAERSKATVDGQVFAGDEIDFSKSGTPLAEIAYRVDVSTVLDTKRAAIVAHRSQIGPDNVFLTMSDDVFQDSLGVEWFNISGKSHSAGPISVELLPGLID